MLRLVEDLGYSPFLPERELGMYILTGDLVLEVSYIYANEYSR